MNAGNVPKALQWVPSASLIKQAFEGLCDNEFPGLRFDPLSADGSGDIVQGEQVCRLDVLLILLQLSQAQAISTSYLAYVWQQHSSSLASLPSTSTLPVSASVLGVVSSGTLLQSMLVCAVDLCWGMGLPLETQAEHCILWTQVLQRLGFEESSVGKTVRAQARILLFNYWATYCILKAKKPNFQPMEPV